MDKVVAHGHHCACPCCPCLNLGNCSRLAWATAWRLGGGVKGGPAYCPKPLWNTKFSFASPFKNHWDAYVGETMGGQSCCPRAPLCMAVSPMSTNLGNPGKVPLRGIFPRKPLLAGPDGSMAVQWEVGVCVGKAKTLITLTATHPPPPHSTPWPVAWVMQHRRTTYNDHLDTRQDGSAGKAGALTACRGEARVQ